MHATDIIAWHYDGAAYCPDCADFDDDTEEASPVFADSLEEEIGATCDTCRACLSDSGEWLKAEDITDKRFYRWSRCAECNDQRPWEINGYGFRDARLSALRGKLSCRNCRQSAVHF